MATLRDELIRAIEAKMPTTGAELLDVTLDVLTQNHQEWADCSADACSLENAWCSCVSDKQVLELIGFLREKEK